MKKQENKYPVEVQVHKQTDAENSVDLKLKCPHCKNIARPYVWANSMNETSFFACPNCEKLIVVHYDIYTRKPNAKEQNWFKERENRTNFPEYA